MKKQLLASASAFAFVSAAGIGMASANPTVMNIEDITAQGNIRNGCDPCVAEQWSGGGGGGGDIEIGTVEIDVELEQEIESIEGGSADGGEGGEDNYAGTNGGMGDKKDKYTETKDDGGTNGAGTNNAGNGGDGGYGGDAKAKNDAYISIENGNIAIISTNELEAENELSFSVFILTGDNDGSFEGGSAEGGEGGEAEVEAKSSGEIEAEAEVEPGPGDANAYAGNATGGKGGYAKGGDGGYIKTGKVYFTTGSVDYGGNAFMHAAGQFNVAANTGIANLNQQGNSVAAHVPVHVDLNKTMPDPSSMMNGDM